MEQVPTDTQTFIDNIKMQVSYWRTCGAKEQTIKERLEGLAFSILVLIDGFGALPPFALRPMDGEDVEGENIAGDLHNLFFAEERKKNLSNLPLELVDPPEQATKVPFTIKEQTLIWVTDLPWCQNDDILVEYDNNDSAHLCGTRCHFEIEEVPNGFALILKNYPRIIKAELHNDYAIFDLLIKEPQ